VARPVPISDLNPHEPTLTAVRRIIPVRLAELYAYAPAVDDPTDARGHHDLRIAAKRLRYTLEIFRFLFPSAFAAPIAQVRQIQDLLGLVHDFDVFVPFFERYLEHRRGEAAAELGRLLFPDADRSGPPRGVADVRHALGLADGAAEREAVLRLIEHTRARRRRVFGEFQEVWRTLVAADFHGSLLAAVGVKPPAAGAPEPAPAPLA
jgi:CHAD domain-containing protein